MRAWQAGGPLYGICVATFSRVAAIRPTVLAREPRLR